MNIRIAGVVNDSIVDGPGFRFTVFTQGCAHACPGCHNPETHDFAGGRDEDISVLLQQMADNPLLDGLTLSGGDPFEQVTASTELAKGAKALGLNVWTYSGYTFEQLIAQDKYRPLLEASDVLIDGPFILAQRTLELRFRGSKNQRLIDVQKTLESGVVHLYALT
ncbi:MAG: anaerobic ribonucleoside-triphosphate reductase activating protein [Clostridia bacterium]